MVYTEGVCAGVRQWRLRTSCVKRGRRGAPRCAAAQDGAAAVTRHWSGGEPEGPRWQHAWKEQGLASSHARGLLGCRVGARCAGRYLATPANYETWVSSSGSLAVKIGSAAACARMCQRCRERRGVSRQDGMADRKAAGRQGLIQLFAWPCSSRSCVMEGTQGAHRGQRLDPG